MNMEDKKDLKEYRKQWFADMEQKLTSLTFVATRPSECKHSWRSLLRKLRENQTEEEMRV